MGRALVAVAVVVAIPIVVSVSITVAVVIAVPAAAVVITPIARPFAPFAGAAVDDFKVGAAAAIDPDTFAVVAPGAVNDSIVSSAVADDEDTVARVRGAEVALHLIRGAIDEGGGAGLPVSGNAEIGAATAIRPNATLAVAPGLALDTGGFATLANQVYAEAGVRGAPDMLHGIRSTIDHVGVAPATEIASTAAIAVAVSFVSAAMLAGSHSKVAAYFKLRAAAMIHPNSAIVEAPSAVLNALGFAFLADHFDSTGGVDGANVTTHVIGGARHAQRALRSRRGVNGIACGCDCQDKGSRNQGKRSERELA
jgi:hypothetical protein